MQLMFCNTYHLLLQPGTAVVEAAGGLHAFMGRRDAPLITDSGGFQVFSLQAGDAEAGRLPDGSLAGGSLKRAASRPGDSGGVLRVREDGVLFRSYRDGARLLLTPETSVAAQKAFGADIILPLDELPPHRISAAGLAASVARSHRWMDRSLRAHAADARGQAMFGIVHGGTDDEARAHSAQWVCARDFDGIAIGGALGRDRAEMGVMLARLLPRLDRARPVHLLGIGDAPSLRAGAAVGIDSFDSAWPTRAGRHGELFTDGGTLKLRSAALAGALRPAEAHCRCPACARHSLAYLHHLYRAREPVLAQLVAAHNVAWTLRAMARIRADILADRL